MPITKVTFPDGQSFSNQSPDDVTDPNETGLADGGHDPGLIELITKVIALVSPLMGAGAVSASAVTIDPGPATFAHVSSWLPALGTVIVARRAADSGAYLIGPVTAATTGSVTMNALLAGGAGTHNDWILTPAIGDGSSRLVDDLDPTLGAALDAAGHDIAGVGQLTAASAVIAALAADLDAGGNAVTLDAVTFRSGVQAKGQFLGEVSGDIVVEAGDPLDIYCTVTGDTTFRVAGGTLPGHGHQHMIHATIGGVGGWAVAVKSLSRLTNATLTSDTGLDSGWLRNAVGVVGGPAITPSGYQATISATGAGPLTHSIVARRPPAAVAPWDYLAAALLKPGTTGRGRVQIRSDTYAKGGYVDFNLTAGTITGSGALSTGTFLGADIIDCGGGWHVVWVAADIGSDGGVEPIMDIHLADAGGGVTFTAAGETLLFGGACLYEGSAFRGIQNVGASRDAVVQGVAIDWPLLAAGEVVDLGVTIEPDGRIVVQDHTVETLS